jgi:serine protease Do
VRRKSYVFAGSCLMLGIVLGATVLDGRWKLLNAQPALDNREQLYATVDRDAEVFEKQSRLLRTVVELSSPFIVHIDAKKRTPGTRVGGARFVEEAGSGIIIENGGRYYVVTNRHVVKDADLERILIRLDDGRELTPQTLNSDPDTDIAVLGITASRLTSARIGNSDDVKIGDFVLAIGSPFGLSRSVTLGIVSAKGRRDLELGGDEIRFQDFIQTDAAINPGNSGGPLINVRGEVVGVNTAIASSSGGNEGIGFSIPINMVMFVARQLITTGEVNRAFLGVNLDAKFGAAAAQQLGLPRQQGARISGVTTNSPASAAGLQVGDIVLEYNGIPVENDVHLVNLVGMNLPGQEVTMLVLRDGRRFPVKIRLGNRKLLEQTGSYQGLEDPRWELPELGLAVIGLTPSVARELQLDGDMQGLIVTDVDPRGPAAGRLRRGDIISGIERSSITQIDDLQRVLDSVDPRFGVRLHILPSGAGQETLKTVVLRPSQSPPKQ